MTTLEQAEELRQKAIALLVREREALDEQLSRLGFDGKAKNLKRACSVCGADDHNVRRCPNLSLQKDVNARMD